MKKVKYMNYQNDVNFLFKDGDQQLKRALFTTNEQG